MSIRLMPLSTSFRPQMTVLLMTVLLMTILMSLQCLQAQTPTLDGATFFGGAGDQAGNALAINGGMIYVGGASGQFVRYAIPPGAPTASSVLTGGFFQGMTATGTTVYPVGAALPPVCGASDGVGDTEAKSMIALYGAASANFVNCFSTNVFPYRGGESYGGVATDGSFLYAMGTAETCGFGNNSFILGKHDLAGALVARVFEPSLDSSGHPCSGDSHGYAIALLNGNIYIAGGSNLTGEDGVFRPVLMRYSPILLTRDWRQRPSDNSGGMFNGVVGEGSAVYAVGYVGVFPNYDYLIEKYSESGKRLWSKISGGAGTDVLNAVVSVGGRLFAVGYTSSQGAGGTDAVVLEFDPSTGSTLSTTTYGGALDDVANAVTTDGTDLYVAGASKSFASAEGNGVGQSDIMLLRYTLAPRIPPVISGLPTLGCTLAPPNHKLVQVATVTASDVLGLSSFNVTATSSEPENGLGDGDTAPDILITGSGLGPRVVQLRAERSGTGAGRTYTITATATNVADLSATATATCVVPHDQQSLKQEGR